MLRKSIVLALIGILAGFLAGCAAGGAFSPAAAPGGVTFVDKDTLKSWLADPNVVVVDIDVRTAADWQQSSSKIKGAIREDPEWDKVQAWGPTMPKDKKIVLYCA